MLPVLERLRQSPHEIVHPDERNFKRFVTSQLVFLLVAPFLLRFIGVFNFEVYYIVAFVWFLCASEILVPKSTDVDWWRWVQWIKVGGFAVFAYIAVQHAAATLQ